MAEVELMEFHDRDVNGREGRVLNSRILLVMGRGWKGERQTGIQPRVDPAK